jgi:hypothetical protein
MTDLALGKTGTSPVLVILLMYLWCALLGFYVNRKISERADGWVSKSGGEVEEGKDADHER